MTCRACEEARRAALAFYDKMATAIRRRAAPVAPKTDEKRYHDQAWFKFRGPSNTREPYSKEELDALRRKNQERR